MTEQFRNYMDAGCLELSLVLSDAQKEQFYRYYELLTEWNRVMNLTAIKGLPDVVEKHFLDSLLLVRVFPNIKTYSYSCMDVGTGAGFPGIPLKIAFPQLKITLLDSLKKRVGFLNEVIKELELSEIHALHGRAEDFGKNLSYREQFDLCVSRAVANLSTLSEYCLPFVKTGGYFFPYKSENIKDEVEQAERAVIKLGGKILSTDLCTLPGTNVERSFISIQKMWITPKKFPRKAGIPGKEPL